jgi:ABC-type antimicrobial peptide transport system permease subunit
LIPFAPLVGFQAVTNYPELFSIESWSLREQYLVGIIGGFLLGVLLLVVILFDMVLDISHAKHRRIVHYRNENPNMSLKFLWANATFYHWFALGFSCLVFFLAGRLFGSN